MISERHTYEYEVDTSSQTAPANVIRMVGRHKRVLEIGCGPGSITKLLAREGLCQVTGMELDSEAIKRVASYCDTVIQADLNSSDWPQLLDGKSNFDVVVAADVLEHLYDPWNTLKRMVPLINSDGYLVISLPHVGHAAVAACLLNGDFEYRDWGLLDRTHIRFFGLTNMQELFLQAGLKIVEAKYVIKPPEDTEFSDAWLHLPANVRTALLSISHTYVYQVVIKAVPENYPGNGIELCPPPLKRKIIPSTTSLKSRIASKLDQKTKNRIRKSLHLFGIRL